IPPAAVVLGTAAAYGLFTLPGAVVTASVGAAVYGLPFGQIWLVVPVVLASALVLAGTGAILGLSMPRPELATIAGQLGMTVVLFLGIITPARLPDAVQALRDIVPGTLAVDALAEAFRVHPHWGGVIIRLLITVGYGAVTLAVASRLFRRAVDR
ncbi:MAG: ABC transporter permease, partial [Frankiaceae bacterium]|nr:ABC transporter permease [Frankiaceae bacterium]